MAEAATVFFGIFLIGCGIFLMIQDSAVGHRCGSFLKRFSGPGDTKNIIVFGILISLSPCLPLFAIVGYIALISDHWLKGVAYMSAFGLGTVISPMIFIALFAGWIAAFLKKHGKLVSVVKTLCGLVIIYLGIGLIQNALRP